MINLSFPQPVPIYREKGESFLFTDIGFSPVCRQAGFHGNDN